MTHGEMKRLVAVFDDIDTTHSGVINLLEFYYLLESPQNEYTRGILRLAPQRSDPKKLSLDDFVEIMVKFACMDKKGVIEFCFETFDEDESGGLDSNELRNLCSAIQVRNDTFFNGNFMRAMEHFDEDKDDQLNRREFRLLSIQFGLIFYPIFRFQNKVRVKTLGRWKWYQIKRRGQTIDACRHFMQTHDGREPPITWFDRVFSCWSHAPRLRHIAIQLYKADQHRRRLETQRAAILFNLGVLPTGTIQPSPVRFQ
ncbi:hypothetical protein SDRG_01429 [Saprolegnia diclina VS20]|uniref:EF-hand domain-containing protein n=1 Tax=Saprolegnia diclina (strain VS20) TaxID=1156394 RepID=T0SF14_SAPDV|nr:hypothetical protein SDRG_01429 [Saprolegnia diclina VS20]EQC41462.1 hypothetical protein SDRG_01429 [Saprolegnia diclina VS20]|eukprot:XP_008605176.1 hypothetical protein SDRG_01429 [Saprolegnia diclina VS20]